MTFLNRQRLPTRALSAGLSRIGECFGRAANAPPCPRYSGGSSSRTRHLGRRSSFRVFTPIFPYVASNWMVGGCRNFLRAASPAPPPPLRGSTKPCRPRQLEHRKVAHKTKHDRVPVTRHAPEREWVLAKSPELTGSVIRHVLAGNLGCLCHHPGCTTSTLLPAEGNAMSITASATPARRRCPHGAAEPPAAPAHITRTTHTRPATRRQSLCQVPPIASSASST